MKCRDEQMREEEEVKQRQNVVEELTRDSSSSQAAFSLPATRGRILNHHYHNDNSDNNNNNDSDSNSNSNNNNENRQQNGNEHEDMTSDRRMAMMMMNSTADGRRCESENTSARQSVVVRGVMEYHYRPMDELYRPQYVDHAPVAVAVVGNEQDHYHNHNDNDDNNNNDNNNHRNEPNNNNYNNDNNHYYYNNDSRYNNNSGSSDRRQAMWNSYDPLLMSSEEKDQESTGSTEGEEEANDILARLYNYMKISEISRYGINVFQKVLETYLSSLTEADIFTLVTSYWCNGIHFSCIVGQRGKMLRNKKVLALPITDALLDAAITGGSSIEKIKQMLKQRRLDNHEEMSLMMCIQRDQEFFLRNCQYRFWNHEVLVKAFLENGWLDAELGQIALDRFASCIYDRRMKNTTITAEDSTHETNNAPLSKEKNNEDTMKPQQLSTRHKKTLPVSTKTLNRWVNVIEILTSHGAKCSLDRFALPVLQQSVLLGTHTWNFITLSTERKNDLLMDACDLTMPLDLWNFLVSFF